MNILRERLVAVTVACALVFSFICGVRWMVIHRIMAGMLVVLVAAMVIHFLIDDEEIDRRKWKAEHQGIMQ